MQEKGYAVACPIIIDVWNASWQQWKTELDKLTIDEDTIFVGLSAGGYALLRYLGESEKRVKKAIQVAPSAPGFDREDGVRFPHQADFYSYEITAQLKSLIRERVV